jgi:predicted O-methyltransferase YrrM
MHEALFNTEAQRRSLHIVLASGDPQARSASVLQTNDGPPNAATLGELYEVSPYTAFELNAHPRDLQGWNSHDNVFQDLIELLEPSRIIEVGVWKGAASIHMAKITQRLGLRCEIVCIDTWLGSPEHFLAARDGARYRSLRLRNGFPQLYYTFLANVVREGVADRITPLPMTSESAVIALKHLKARADIIHIDAAHEYDPVLRDFRAYWPLLSERGVIVGDDYIMSDSVTRAANDFADEVGRTLCGFRPKCVIAKAADIRYRPTILGE